MTTSILWFSRHAMTQEQISALEVKYGTIAVTQVNGSMPNVHVGFEAYVNGAEEVTDVPPFKEQVKGYDVVAIVAPINLQQQITGIAGDKPVIFAKTNRLRTDGDNYVFQFAGWERLVKIEVVTEPFA